MWCGCRQNTRPGLEAQNPVALGRAPEICIEVLSLSNSPAEMNEKRDLYFEAGAHEVWICGRVRGDTDVDNTPMAKVFQSVGYRQIATRREFEYR